MASIKVDTLESLKRERAELDSRMARAVERDNTARLEQKFSGRTLSPKESMNVSQEGSIVTTTVDTSKVAGTMSASGKSVTYCAGYTKDIMVDGQRGYVRHTIGVYNKDFNLAS